MLYNNADKKIYSLVDNELESVESFLGEWCPNSEINTIESEFENFRSSRKSLREKSRSYHYHKNKVRDSWRESHIMPDSFESFSPRVESIDTVRAQGVQRSNESQIFQSVQASPDLQSVQASPVDMRPHLYDKISGQYLLLDSGAQISACPPDPGDSEDPSMTLRAANGSKMKCYGTKRLSVRINRKEYSIQAIKTDVKTPILGWNFVKKHRLGFEWNDWGDICLVDKKAKISATLKYRALPHGNAGLSAINIKGSRLDPDSQESQFELACMEALTPKLEDDKIENDIDKLPDSQYKVLLKKFPDLLQLHFEEEFTKNGIQHRILTGDAKPTKAKKRNMLPGSPREVAAKAAFMKLVDLGIVEPVNSGDPNNWVSPIHFVPKPGGGLRPVGDYRDLNSKTELDQYPLPNVKAWTQEVRGATIFSKVDLCKAFHQILIDKRDRWKTCVSTPWPIQFQAVEHGT